MSSYLPPLNSVKQCIKCGSTYGYGSQGGKGDYAPGMEWHKGLIRPSDYKFPCCAQCYNSPSDATVEHLSRSCLHCGYRWAEQCYQPEQGSLI
jgi:hypothetical protein